MNEPLGRNIFWPLFFLAAGLLFFVYADRITVYSGDEGRFSEVAREIYESRDFVTPHFNYTKLLEKPILAYLIAALSCFALGVSAFAVRLPGILAALTIALMTYWMARRSFGRGAGLWSAAVLMTSAGYVVMARMAMIDMVLTLFMTLALYSFMMAAIEKRRGFYDLAYAAMGCALITKGLIGVVLPSAVFGAYLVLSGDWKELRHTRPLRGVVIIALIFVPWFVAISKQTPEFAQVFFGRHQVQRFATGTFGRHKPFWFYLPVLALVFFPWALFLPHAVRGGLKRPAEERKKILFLALWIAVIVGFFTIPKSKLIHYMLPVSAPVAMLVGAMLDEAVRRAKEKQKNTLVGGIFLGLAVSAPFAASAAAVYLNHWGGAERWAALAPASVALAVLCGPVGFISWRFFRKGDLEAMVRTSAATLLAIIAFVVIAMYALSPQLSTFGIAQSLLPRLEAGDVVAVYASPDRFSDFPFHLKRRVVVAGSDYGTLAEGRLAADDEEAQREWFIDAATLVRKMSTGTDRVYCLMKSESIDELTELGLKNYETLFSDHDRLLIVNRPEPA